MICQINKGFDHSAIIAYHPTGNCDRSRCCSLKLKSAFDYFERLPDELKNYVQKGSMWSDSDWLTGERMLNMLAVERDSIEFIISQFELRKEYEKDFADWKLTQDEKISDKVAANLFTHIKKIKDFVLKTAMQPTMPGPREIRRFPYSKKN